MKVEIIDNGTKSGNIVRAELYIDGAHFADLLDPDMDHGPITRKKWERCVEIIRAALEESK